MREIKFRAWLPIGEWDEEGENQAYEMCYDLAFEEFEPINDLLKGVEFLMQFTGLLDKNGKEIFEGDVVEINCPTDTGCYEIVINDGSIRFKSGDTLYYDYKIFEDGALLGGNLKVIGNVHENKELLGE